jgi:hypothetical protein
MRARTALVRFAHLGPKARATEAWAGSCPDTCGSPQQFKRCKRTNYPTQAKRRLEWGTTHHQRGTPYFASPSIVP